MTATTVRPLPADPLDALRELARFDHEIQRLRRHKVRAARLAGASWEQIGTALGMSRQSAWERYSREVLDDIAASMVSQDELSVADAMSLAVDEVRAARRGQHAR